MVIAAYKGYIQILHDHAELRAAVFEADLCPVLLLFVCFLGN